MHIQLCEINSSPQCLSNWMRLVFKSSMFIQLNEISLGVCKPIVLSCMELQSLQCKQYLPSQSSLSPEMPLQVLLLYQIWFRPYVGTTAIQLWNAGVAKREDQWVVKIKKFIYPSPETYGPCTIIHFRWRIQIYTIVSHGFFNEFAPWSQVGQMEGMKCIF